jgi:hypothetical protein
MQVFISHSSTDRDLAGRLSRTLQDAGFDVWRPESIFHGDNWALETGKALEKSELMVVLVTKNALGSAILRQDVQFALTSGNYRGRVVPVLVDSPTIEAGKDIPWILLRLAPIWVEGAAPDFSPVVKRVQEEIENGCNAPA